MIGPRCAGRARSALTSIASKKWTFRYRREGPIAAAAGRRTEVLVVCCCRGPGGWWHSWNAAIQQMKRVSRQLTDCPLTSRASIVLPRPPARDIPFWVNRVAANVRAALLLCPRLRTYYGVVANQREWADSGHCPFRSCTSRCNLMRAAGGTCRNPPFSSGSTGAIGRRAFQIRL